MTKWIAVLFSLALPGFVSAQTWEIDPSHSSVGFAVSHMMVSSTKGQFKKFSGTVVMDAKDASKNKIDVSIDAASVDTNDAKRDEHLRSPDFFDVKKFPAITFKSTSVKSKGPKKLAVAGDLTIRGVTKPVKFDATLTPEVKDPWGNIRRGAQASLKINRKDYGIVWNKSVDAGGVVVGDEVTINLEVEGTKKQEAASAPAADASGAKAAGGANRETAQGAPGQGTDLLAKKNPKAGASAK
jgi:polyisoprenoid-binding protein YceI